MILNIGLKYTLYQLNNNKWLIVTIILISLYSGFTNLYFTLAYIPTLLIIFILYQIIPPKGVQVKISIPYVISISFVSIFLVNSLLICDYFYTGKNLPNQEILYVFFTHQIKSMSYIIGWLCFISIYMYTAYLAGYKTWKLKSLDRLSTIYLQTLLGLTVISLVMVILGTHKLLNIFNLSTILLGLIFFNLKHTYLIYRKVIISFSKKIQLKISRKNLILLIFLFIGISVYTISSLKEFPIGPDAYRGKLLMVKYIAENGQLPTTNIRANVPFLAEIILVPAYIIGGQAFAGLTLSSFHYLTGIGLLLLVGLSDYGANYKKILAVIMTIFSPIMQAFVINEFKIEPVLVTYTVALFLLLKTLTESKELNNLGAIMWFISILFLIKVLSFYWTLPALIIISYYIFTTINHSPKKVGKIVIYMIIGILPILIWIYFYRFRLPILGIIGLGLSPQGFKFPIEHLSDISCNIDLPYLELEKLYNFHYSHPLLIPVYAISYIHLYFQKENPGINMMTVTYLGIILPILTLYKLNEVSKNTWYRIIFIISCSSFIFYFIFSPIILWYVLPILTILSVYLLVWALSIKIKLIEQIVYIHFIVIVTLGVISSMATFSPLNSYELNLPRNRFQSLYSKDNLTNNATIARNLPENLDGNILYSSSYYAFHAHLFNKFFYDKTIFYDLISNNNNENLINIIHEYDVRYVVITNYARDYEIECVKDSFRAFEDKFNELSRNQEIQSSLIVNTAPYSLYEIHLKR